MKRKSYKKYILFCCLFLSVVSLPANVAEVPRLATRAFFSPFWRKTSKLSKRHEKDQELQRLETENHLLRIEMAKLRAALEQTGVFADLKKEGVLDFDKDVVTELECYPASVIYRDPTSWTNCFWIDIGEKTNQQLKKCVVQKNSPVVVGKAIVGAVDYVGKKQSRVRLITDACLKPSVRAARGRIQNAFFAEHADCLARYIKNSPNPKPELIKDLEKLKQELCLETETHYLAKGILQGGGTPFWRSLNHTLSGIGFNYDFADSKGPARELLSGKAIDATRGLADIAILKVSDLLVTTGMDGVFPAGFRVAEVTKIFPLREGAYTYQLEAEPACGNLDTLHTVFIIPALGFNQEDLCQIRP